MAHDEVVQDLVGKGKWMSEVSYDNMKMLRIQINSSHVTKDFPTSNSFGGAENRFGRSCSESSDEGSQPRNLSRKLSEGEVSDLRSA